MNKTAVIYARVSTDEQAKGYSLTTQLEACRRFAADRGYDVIATFSEDYTGASMDRPELNNLRKLIFSQHVDSIIVYDVDRLARKSVYQMLIDEEFHKAGAIVEYVIGQYDDSDEGRLQKQIRASIAEYEKAKILERSKRGKRGKAQSGFVIVGNRPPYGYRVASEPHKTWLEIDEEEAKIVRLVYDLYLKGDGLNNPLSINKIATRLTEMGILTRGDKKAHVAKKRELCVWQPAMVRHILDNETYTGVWHFGKTKMVDDGKERPQKPKRGSGKQVARSRDEWIAVSVPAIINREEYEQARERVKINIEQSARCTKHEYLLGRRLKCKKCNYSYVGRTRKGHQYYYCKGTEMVPVHLCDMPVFRAAQVEDAVWNWVRSIIDNPDALKKGAKEVQEKSRQENQPLYDRLEFLKEQIENQEQQLNKLLDLYLSGEFSKSMLSERKLRLESTLLKLKQEQASTLSQLESISLTEDQFSDIEAFCKEIRPRLEIATFGNKRHLIDLLDVRATLAVENEERVAYVTCKLQRKAQRVSLVQTSPSSNIGGTVIPACTFPPADRFP